MSILMQSPTMITINPLLLASRIKKDSCSDLSFGKNSRWLCIRLLQTLSNLSVLEKKEKESTTSVLAPLDILAIISSTVLSLPGFSRAATLWERVSVLSVFQSLYPMVVSLATSLLIPDWFVQWHTERCSLLSKIWTVSNCIQCACRMIDRVQDREGLYMKGDGGLSIHG